LQPVHGQQDRPVLIEHIEIGRQTGPVGTGHPRKAVTGGAGGSVGTNSVYAQRQQQTGATCDLGVGMSRNRLKTGIKQGGMHAIGALLRADRARQPDLGQHCAGRIFRAVHCGQSGESRTVLKPVFVELLTHLGPIQPAWAGRE
jgi:hypothetical protein